jgi:MFS family permease
MTTTDTVLTPPLRSRVSLVMVLSALGAALGGLLFGFDTAVISGTTAALQSRFALSDGALGFTVASALIGTVIGSLIAGAPADRFGRKPMLLAVAICYVVSSLGTGLAFDWYSLIGFRFLGGLAIGAASVVTPIYIAEVSPAHVRGRLVALNQLNIVLGILLAFLSNYAIASLAPADVAWRWMFGIVAVPSVLFLVVTFVLPDSPRWLVVQDRGRRGRADARGGRPRRGQGQAEPLPGGLFRAGRLRHRHRHVQSALGHQRAALLRAAHLPTGRGRGRQRSAAVGGRGRHQSRLHDPGAVSDRSFRPQAAALFRLGRHRRGIDPGGTAA